MAAAEYGMHNVIRWCPLESGVGENHSNEQGMKITPFLSCFNSWLIKCRKITNGLHSLIHVCGGSGGRIGRTEEQEVRMD